MRLRPLTRPAPISCSPRCAAIPQRLVASTPFNQSSSRLWCDASHQSLDELWLKGVDATSLCGIAAHRGEHEIGAGRVSGLSLIERRDIGGYWHAKFGANAAQAIQ